MASEVKLPEPALEEKKAPPEVIDFQAINNFVGTQNIKEQLGIKSSVVDANTVNDDVDLVKEETEIPSESKLGISVEPSEDITEKPETLEEELKELQEEQKCEEAPSPIVETINGDIENGAHSNQFTEELPPEVVRADESPANGTSSSSEEIQEKSASDFSNVEKIDSEEVLKEDAPQSQIPEKAEADKDVIQSDTATLSDKDCHKEAEILVGDAKQTEKVEIPSTTTPPVTEEVSAEAEGKNDILEEVEQEKIHQTEVAKEDLAEEKECQEETEGKSRGVSETLTAEETILEEAGREDQTPEMTSEETAKIEETSAKAEIDETGPNDSEETAKIEETSAKAEIDETGPTDSEETTPHEDSNSHDSPITNEENRKGNEESEHLSEEVKDNDVTVTTTPLISEEDKGSAEINEETKEEAQQNQNSEGDEIDKEASQSTPVTDLSDTEHQNETEKEMENASADPEEQIIEKVDLKEVESVSVSEQVSEEKEKIAEEEQKEQAADENCAEEECPPDAGIQNTDAAGLVVSEGTVPEEAIPESKTPDPEMQISEEVVPTEGSIGVSEKDETGKNDKEEDTTEEPGKPDEYSEHISDKSAVENAVSRDVTPEIEITDAEKTVTAETDNTDIKKSENEDEEKNFEEIEPSESSPETIQIEEATPNDCEEEKQGDDTIEHIETNHEQEIESCLETEEQLEASKPSTSGEELSPERETIETKLIEEKADEDSVAQDEITLDSKETAGNNDEVANCDVKDDETGEINLAEEHVTNDGINEDEEANKGNVEEISELTKTSDNTQESSTSELQREEIPLETENDLSSELAKSEEVLLETTSEGTALSEIENIEHKANDSERDDTEAGNLHETIELKEDEKSNTNEPGEMVHDFEVDEKPEEILSGNIEHETTPSIQNEEDPPEKDENINNETTEEEHITEVEGSTVVTEVPAEEVQNSISERSYEIDQSIPETASEQDNLPIASVGSEIEAEKPEIGDASSLPQIDDKSEMEVEPKEKTEDENLIHEEVTQKVEEVEEPCTISHGKEEVPEEESTIVHEETSIEPNISTVQQDQQTEESDANPIEAHNATDDISVEEGSEATTTVKELEESTEQIDQCIDRSNAAKVELSQSETVAPETEILEVTPSEKVEEESNPTDMDAKPAELEETAEKSTEQEEVSTEPSNTRELQIDQTDITAEQDQPSEESEVKPTEPDQATEDVPTVEKSEIDDATVSESVSEVENSEIIGESGASAEQIEDVSVDKEESVVLQEEDVAVPEEDGQEIEAENEKHVEVLSKEEESTIVHEETLIEPDISSVEQDKKTEESDANPIEAHNATDDISVEEGSEANTTVISSIEQTSERAIDKEGTTSIQEENNVEAPNEEAKVAKKLEESTEQIDQCTDRSNAAEIELSQSEIVAPETEILEVTPSEKVEEESNPTDMDAKPAELEETAEKSTEQEEVSSERSNTTELQIDQTEITAEQDQPSEESEVMPTEPDQATEDVPAVENSEVESGASVDQIEDVSEVENSDVIGESGETVVLQEEDVAVPEEEGQKIEAENEKHIEEDPQITSPSEVNQTETIAPETENLEAVSNEILGDENKHAGTDIKLAEAESAIEEPSEEKEIPTEFDNTTELQVDQAEIIAEQDQPSEESEVKPTELDQTTEEVPPAENLEVDTTVRESVEEIGETSVAKEESVLPQEEGVDVEIPEEKAANEKQIEEEVPQITDPSEVSEVELNQSEPVSAETEILKTDKNEELGDENKLAGTDINLAKSESTTEIPTEEKEIPTELGGPRELQTDETEIIAEQDEPGQESDIKPSESDIAINELSPLENSEVAATVSERVEGIGEDSIAKEECVILQEDNVAVKMPQEEAGTKNQIEEEVPQITDSSDVGSSDVTKVELHQSETVPPETETLDAISNEELGDENKLAGTDIKLAEFESTIVEPSEEKEIPMEPDNTRELQEDQAESITEKDQPSEESEVKPIEPDQAIEEVPTVKNAEVDATVSERVEEIGEGVAAEMPEEEATKEKQIEEEVSQITNESEVSEVKLNQSETVPPEAEILEAIPHDLEAVSSEELGDDNKLAGTDIKLAEFESTTEEPSEEKEISTEPTNARELQIDQAEQDQPVDQADVIAEQDEPSQESSQESEVKPTELDQSIEVPTIENSKVDAAVSESAEEIVESSVVQEDVAIKMPEDEATNEKKIEEEVSQITNPSEVTEVELNQSETVPAESETLEADSNEELGDENKLADTNINLVKSEGTVEVPTDEKEVPTESNDTRELQIDQSEIIAEQDEPSQESDVKPTEPDEATEEVSVAEKSDIVDDTVTATMEESKEESVIFEEDDVAVEMPVEEVTNEQQIKPEVTEVVHPSEITEEQLAVTDTETEGVGTEATDGLTELKSDQMKNLLEGLTEEKLDAGVSSGAEQTIEKSEVSEVLCGSTSEQVEGEETDARMIKEETDQGVEAAEEPCEKYIEGEIHRTADPEIDDATEERVKPEITEKEVDPQVFEPQTESPEQEKATEESASVEEMSEASATLVPGETQTEETESGILPQSVSESVIVSEEKISREIEKNEEEIPTTADSEICDSVEAESNDVLNEKEVDPPISEAQPESPEQERETEESALPVENSVAAAPIPDEGQIEETEIANKEDGLLVQTMPESVVQPEETISQEVEANEESTDKHIAGEILRTVDPAEVSYTAEESKVILTEEDADSQKLATETEVPEQDETTKESTLIEEKSDATASLLPGDEPQNTAESVAAPEEGVSQEAEAETSGEFSVQEVTRESTIISNEEEVHSDKLTTEIESPDPVRAAEELEEEKAADAGNVVPGDGQVEEREIANMESCVAPETEGIIESVNVPEESVPRGIETDDEPSDKHIVGEEDEVEPAQITASPVEQPDIENSGTELESALLEKKNNEVDVKANVDEAGSTSFEGAIINQTDNESETVPVVEHINAEDEEPKGHTERDIDATVFLKTPEKTADEINEHTEDTVPNFSEQNKEVEEEANQSEEPEQGFASIVSSFLINKVLSEENQKIDDAIEQNNAASVIPKTSDDETIQEVTTTRNEPETRDEDVPYATNSTEDLKPEQEQEEESAVKEVREDEQEDGVEQDYLPVSRFLMDKILRQEDTKYPEKEVETVEEPDKHVISDGGIQVQEEFEENSTLVVAPPEQKGEAPSSYSETARDFGKENTLIGEVGNTSIGDGAISSEEKIEETISVEELPKQGEGNHSPKEVATDLEKEEKPADEALEHIEDENKSLVSDVAEQEGERSISPAEATRDFDKEDATIEQKNEGIVPIEDKVEEITGEKIVYPVQVGEFQHEKPAEEKDVTLNSNATSFTVEVEDLACGEKTKDLVEETVVNAPEISEPEKIMEESETAVMQKEDEHKDEAVAGEQTPKDVKNVEENYVFVEHEVNQSEEPKEVLEEKVADEVSDAAAITNLKEEQTGLSAEIHDEKRDMPDSTENCPKIEQNIPDIPEVPIVTEIVKEHVGNEADFVHGEEQVKEVTGTVSFENKSQEKASEMEAAKMEKKSEEIEDEEQEEDEEEQEIGHQEREAEITGGDPTVKSEAKETEMKSGQKKSLNILSGVGLKVITFTKVKKAFTGKSFTKVKKAFTGKSKSASPSAK